MTPEDEARAARIASLQDARWTAGQYGLHDDLQFLLDRVQRDRAVWIGPAFFLGVVLGVLIEHFL